MRYEWDLHADLTYWPFYKCVAIKVVVDVKVLDEGALIPVLSRFPDNETTYTSQ